MLEILEIIKSTETEKANVNPTLIYNEGWMTRLLIYYSIQEKIQLNNINFSTINNWTSEALISSPFVGVSKVREGYTHADIVLGDFSVDYKVTGKLTVNDDAKVFGIIEAKMKSKLSKVTANAPEYNQASRSIACIANNIVNDCQTFFYVVLPESEAKKRNRAKITISDVVTTGNIKVQIENRINYHNIQNEESIDANAILQKVEKCTIGVITYEEWIKLFTNENITITLNEFYRKCIKWNRL